ncbi:MAG: cupin domain-containing protein [Fidelibacterota bacterium]|nr:MAG: cupin domain-containing protein [Candidatus Neomarinimicrobiota bacterium]
MDAHTQYVIQKNVRFNPLEVVDIPKVVAECQEEWFNQTLCRVNDCLVRLGILKGEFHWHRHEMEDEFFYVIEGRLLIDLEGREVELLPRQGFTVPKGVPHRTRAPERTVVLMIEGSTVDPTGD